MVERDIDGDESRASVVFEPSRQYQEEAGEQGLAGQLLVNYDVDRKGQVNEVQVIDGYFVHYFTPENLPTLPKHVIFVLDVSGSMAGDKMTQLKDAMFTILDDMTDRDFFNIVTFSSMANTWQLDTPNVKEYDNYADFAINENIVVEEPFVIKATEENKKVAIKYILSVSAGGGTNINDGLLEGLKIAGVARKK